MIIIIIIIDERKKEEEYINFLKSIYSRLQQKQIENFSDSLNKIEYNKIIYNINI